MKLLFSFTFDLLHLLKLTRYFKHVIKQYFFNVYNLSKKMEWLPIHVSFLVNVYKYYFLKHKLQPWKNKMYLQFFKRFQTWYYIGVTALNNVIYERWTSKMQEI